jgi:hypothetical protein
MVSVVFSGFHREVKRNRERIKRLETLIENENKEAEPDSSA